MKRNAREWAFYRGVRRTMQRAGPFDGHGAGLSRSGCRWGLRVCAAAASGSTLLPLAWWRTGKTFREFQAARLSNRTACLPSILRRQPGT